MNEQNRQLISSPSRGSVGVVDSAWVKEAEGAWFEVDGRGNGCIGVDGVKLLAMLYFIETNTPIEPTLLSRLTANLHADLLGVSVGVVKNGFANNISSSAHSIRRNHSFNSTSSPRRSPYSNFTLRRTGGTRQNPAVTLVTLSKFKKYCISKGLTKQDLHNIRIAIANLKAVLGPGSDEVGSAVFSVLDVPFTSSVTHFANYLVSHLPPSPSWLVKDSPEEEMALELLCRYQNVDSVRMDDVRRDGRASFTFGVVCKWWENHNEHMRRVRRRWEEVQEEEEKPRGWYLPIRTWRDEVEDGRVYRVKEGFVDGEGGGECRGGREKMGGGKRGQRT